MRKSGIQCGEGSPFLPVVSAQSLRRRNPDPPGRIGMDIADDVARNVVVHRVVDRAEVIPAARAGRIADEKCVRVRAPERIPGVIARFNRQFRPLLTPVLGRK